MASRDRIEILKERIESLGGTVDIPESLDDAVAQQFLEQVLQLETKPVKRLRDWLCESGYEPPATASLSDSDLPEELWRFIGQLAFLGCEIECTDHLDDRELYERLLEELESPVILIPDNPDYAMHLDMIGRMNDEDLNLYLTYYASEATRRRWSTDFPKFPVPKKLPRPFDRDRHLPGARDRNAVAV
jgi:hypothetical protein